jgi:hypothetical protein
MEIMFVYKINSAMKVFQNKFKFSCCRSFLRFRYIVFIFLSLLYLIFFLEILLIAKGFDSSKKMFY